MVFKLFYHLLNRFDALGPLVGLGLQLLELDRPAPLQLSGQTNGLKVFREVMDQFAGYTA